MLLSSLNHDIATVQQVIGRSDSDSCFRKKHFSVKCFEKTKMKNTRDWLDIVGPS